MLTHVTEVTPETLHDAVAMQLVNGRRFVTISCTDLGDVTDLLYHFDFQYQLSHLRLRLPKGQPLPSISGVCFSALVIENELKDLFGLNVAGLALDYESRFLLSEGAPVAPFRKAMPDAVTAKEQV